MYKEKTLRLSVKKYSNFFTQVMKRIIYSVIKIKLIEFTIKNIMVGIDSFD